MTVGYELLYLVASTKSKDELNQIIDAVNQLLKKEKAELLHHKLWSQRSLAYPIKKAEHAFYVLCYFKADGTTVGNIRRGAQLMNDILRSVIIHHDDIKQAIKRFTVLEEKTKKPKETAPERAAATVPKDLRPTPSTVSEEKKQVDGAENDVAKEQKLPKAVAKALEESREEEKAEPKEAEIKIEALQEEVSPDLEPEDRKPTKSKKSSLDELDKKLEDILGGEIEL